MLNNVLKSVKNGSFKLKLTTNNSLELCPGVEFSKLFIKFNSSELKSELIRIYKDAANEVLANILNSDNSILMESPGTDSINKLNELIKNNHEFFYKLFESGFNDKKKLLESIQ